ncbi:jg9834, partial [Pararge aegeria aegeria]
MGAPQTPKQIDDDDSEPHVAVVEETRQEHDRKLDRKRGQSCPRRRGLENELEGERRRLRRKPN